MDSAISLPSVVVGVPDQISCRLDDGIVLLDLNKGVYFGLNDVGSLIWELIQRHQRVEALYSAVLEQYEGDPETCRRDVLRLLKDLREAGLANLVPA